MSFAGPNPEREGIRASKVLSREDDAEVRDGIFDRGYDHDPKDGLPQVMIGNSHTGCHGSYFPRAHGRAARFTFRHGTFKNAATKCGCLVKGGPGALTEELPKELVEHGIKLHTEQKLETKFASIIMAKLFLGLYVPESVRGSFPEGRRCLGKLDKDTGGLLSPKAMSPERGRKRTPSKDEKATKKPPWRGP
ncbi:hypothetical protein G7054_g6046 [Neopestalotiopsis clavispora]|nr:hypothetical protein G7054_g6046 [Neopestalotiopsis clavispora]